MKPQQRNLALGGAALLIIGYFALFHGTKSGDGKDPTGNGGGGDNSGFDALKVATDLYNAMKDSGTNESAIVRILTPVTQSQFDLVFKAFGELKYNPTFGNQISFYGELDRYNLQEWLEYELSEAEYATLRKRFPKKL